VKGREYSDERLKKELEEMLRGKNAMPTRSAAVFVQDSRYVALHFFLLHANWTVWLYRWCRLGMQMILAS
jgi:hypothetical protein